MQKGRKKVYRKHAVVLDCTCVLFVMSGVPPTLPMAGASSLREPLALAQQCLKPSIELVHQDPELAVKSTERWGRVNSEGGHLVPGGLVPATVRAARGVLVCVPCPACHPAGHGISQIVCT